MCITKLSPTALTGAPDAAISMPVASIATCPFGSRSTAKIAAGSAAIARETSIRSEDCCAVMAGALLSRLEPSPGRVLVLGPRTTRGPSGDDGDFSGEASGVMGRPHPCSAVDRIRVDLGD